MRPFSSISSGVKKNLKKLENVAIAGHCNLRPPGLPPEPPTGRTLAAATPPTVGMTLAALYSAWAGGMENIFEIFQFYPFRVPIAPMVLGVGGTGPPHVWCGGRPIIGPW